MVRSKLGAGAFGTVFRAYDTQLDRDVALKVPNPGVMTDGKRAERFLREAKAAANLRHPHIVPVFDAGKDGGNCYIASAFIEGQPLAESIPEGGADFIRAARIVRELADALAYAHEQGIVHRDVKPANIMLDKQDRVHLMDFGLASRQEESAKLTNDGAVMGTPAYMSPEQAKGQKGEAKPATDQYAAGVVLYELLTGTAPFRGSAAAVLHSVVNTEPDPPRKHRPDVPRDLETICLKAMAKRPEDRYAACHLLAADLRRWLEGEPVSARPLGPRERAARWVRKEPKLAGAILAVALIVLVSFVAVSFAARRAAVYADEAETARFSAERDVEAARAAEKRAADALADAQAAREREQDAIQKAVGAEGTLEGVLQKFNEAAGNARQAKAEAEQERMRAGQEKQRGNQEKLRADREHLRAETEKAGADSIRDAIVQSDLGPKITQAAYQKAVSGHADAAGILLGLVPEKERRWEWHHTANAGQPGAACEVFAGHKGAVRAAFSPDGSRLATAGTTDEAFLPDGLVRVWDVKDRKLVHTLKGHRGEIHSVAYSADGARIVTASEDKTVRVWNADKGTEVLTLNGHTSRVYSAQFSPDGGRVITAGGDHQVIVWDAKTGAKRQATKWHDLGVMSASFSPDGTHFVSVGRDHAMKIVDTSKWYLRDDYRGYYDVVQSAQFSADGSRVVLGAWDGTVKVWDMKAQKVSLTIRGHEGKVYAASFSPDGTRIVSGGADGTAKVWNAKTGELVLTLKAHPGGVHSASFSENGMKLVTGGADGTAKVWDGTPAPKP